MTKYRKLLDYMQDKMITCIHHSNPDSNLVACLGKIYSQNYIAIKDIENNKLYTINDNGAEGYHTCRQKIFDIKSHKKFMDNIDNFIKELDILLLNHKLDTSLEIKPEVTRKNKI